ncbi:MAG: hypothetical protein JWP33_2884 [Blastococcus sp.]|nr:hypothetical protein [Blastococcus sp.]
MNAVLAAALVWPFVLLGIGLLVGLVLRHGDQLTERRPAATTSSPGQHSGRHDADGGPLPVTLPGSGRS